MLNKQITIPDQYLPPYPIPGLTNPACDPKKDLATPLNYNYFMQEQTSGYHYSFLPRIIPDWNNLYIYIEDINELDLTQFRYCLMKFLTDCR